MFPFTSHITIARFGQVLTTCVWVAVCSAMVLFGGHQRSARAQSAGGSAAAGIAVIAPPRSLGSSTSGSPLLAQGSGTGSLGTPLREPPRQIFSMPAPATAPGTFDPYALSSPGPVLVPPSSGSSSAGLFSGMSGGLFGGGNSYDEAIWDDVTGIYEPGARHDWTAQFLPDGILYRAYLAGVKESRLSTVFNHDSNYGWMWDIRLGGRVGLFRYGTTNEVRPEGFQIDIEGSGQPRLNLDENMDLDAADFRAGLPITYGIGKWQSKFAYYHLSSHVGDEYLVRNPGFQRINYARDVLVFGQGYYLSPDVRVYGEVGWAFYSDVSEPWEFQFGAEYSPLTKPGIGGAPFAAINGQSRQELDFGGNVVVQAGWQWRGRNRGHLMRLGVQYYNGKSDQFEFYNQSENKLGIGLWYDY
ncbi:MAG: DUF1207 domain-containing protein [Planctomycetes bacterium]|nr:DUF1207 domain-containing protein [Planctomycetota bacterium]